MTLEDELYFGERIRLSTDALLQAHFQQSAVLGAANIIARTFEQGGKVLICGNGGSAACAEHIAAELVGRFAIEGRRALPAIALTGNSSVVTAVGNDYGFEEVFHRQVQALGRPGDVLVGLSTSGNSMNVVEAVQAAKGIGLRVIAFIGQTRCALASACGTEDVVIAVPCADTPIIQQVHMVLAHILCGMVERRAVA